MFFSKPKPEPAGTRILAQTRDPALAQLMRTTFSGSARIDVAVLEGSLAEHERKLEAADATVVLVDVDPKADFPALERLSQRLAGAPPLLVVIPAFDQEVARQLLQMRISDFLVRPVAPLDLMRACARLAQGPKPADSTEARIYTFLPAAGGVGLTTLAIETAMLLLRSGPGERASTCLVDLDFQQGACADYLDLEPRLDLDEIVPRPERLDRQLLEVMLSHHASGLSLIAAPNRPAEMRSFDFEVVTRLLDLVATHFDNVVIDVPRTWFPWTDSVLVGSNRLFIVTEMTVPGLRHAKHLVSVIRNRLTDVPKPEVIVNRFDQPLFGTGLRRADIEQTLGDSFAATIPNNYRLVREAIDRGVTLDEVKAGSNITAALRRLVLPEGAKAKAKGERKFALAR